MDTPMTYRTQNWIVRKPGATSRDGIVASQSRAAAEIGAKVLWFQPGTDSDAAVRLAREAGLVVVSGRCMGATHGELGLGPGPHAAGWPS
jgi:hypothetical protein